MNCTATTRLTAEECLARLDACPVLPRGERLAWACESPSLWNRACRHRQRPHFVRQPLWGLVATIGSIAEPRTNGGHILDWWLALAAPVRRLRAERQALRAQLIKMCAALLLEKAVGLASVGRLEQAWWAGRKCRLCGESMRCKNGCGIKCTGEERHYMGDHGEMECLQCGAKRGEP